MSFKSASNGKAEVKTKYVYTIFKLIARFFFKKNFFYFSCLFLVFILNLLSEVIMTKIRKSFLQFVFSGSMMRRWNDKLRPVELYEIDKQAHKMITAFLLYQLKARDLEEDIALELGVDIIEGCIFDYLYRLVITDIKPPVFYQIRENREHYEQLTNWVFDELEPLIRPIDDGFWQRFVAYHRDALDHQDDNPAKRILTASHLFASKWEFNLIRSLNFFDEELRDIDASFTEQLQSMKDVQGVSDLLVNVGNPFARVANFCGQLRFQIRWSQTARVPETSVLGHMFIVALLVYIMSIEQGLSKARCVNNFFCGLFHDLPELLTRDIINPVKKSIKDLPEIIHQYEKDELERRILDELRRAGYEDIVERLSYYLGVGFESEFLEQYKDELGIVHTLSSFEEMANYNEDKYDGKDGKLVKACDSLAALLEVYSSIYHGVASAYLYDAMARIKAECKNYQFGDFDLKALLADFN